MRRACYFHLVRPYAFVHSAIGSHVLMFSPYAAVPETVGQSGGQSTGELVELVTAGLAELARVRPENPAAWLGKWMLENRDLNQRS